MKTIRKKMISLLAVSALVGTPAVMFATVSDKGGGSNSAPTTTQVSCNDLSNTCSNQAITACADYDPNSGGTLTGPTDMTLDNITCSQIFIAGSTQSSSLTYSCIATCDSSYRAGVKTFSTTLSGGI
jgi:hypothetical protein